MTSNDSNESATESSLVVTIPESLSQTALGKRLGCSGEAIRQKRVNGSLKEWSQSKDPSGIAWQWGEDKKYHPIR